MRETLYIRLGSGAPDGLVEFAIAEDQAARSSAVGHDSLEAVLDRAAGRRIVVLVPGGDVRLTAVTVPVKQPAKVLQAAPYLLEEQLADDVDTLHFALGPRQADGSNPVAVVTLARMNAWMAPFRARDLHPAAVIPETLCLPWDGSGRWSALVEADLVSVRSAAYGGFSCDPADLVTYLQLADPDKTSTLRLLLPTTVATDYTGLDWPVELLPGFSTGLQALVAHCQLDSTINLLQGRYSQRQDLDRLWRPWRAAALLALLCLIGAGTAFGIDTWRLNKALQLQEDANLQRFQQLFPNEARIVDIGAQLDQQLRALTGGASNVGLFPLLEVLAQALAANSGLQLQSLQFRDAALYLSLKGTDLQVLETLRAWFASQRGVNLEVQSANAGSDGVQIRLKLTSA